MAILMRMQACSEERNLVHAAERSGGPCLTALSNGLFLVPAGFSMFAGQPLHAMVVLGAAASSTYYHWQGEAEGLILDRAYAWLLVACNLQLLHQAGWPVPCAAAAVALAAVGLYRLWICRRDDWVWHALSAGVTAACATSPLAQ